MIKSCLSKLGNHLLRGAAYRLVLYRIVHMQDDEEEEEDSDAKARREAELQQIYEELSQEDARCAQDLNVRMSYLNM